MCSDVAFGSWPENSGASTTRRTTSRKLRLAKPGFAAKTTGQRIQKNTIPVRERPIGVVTQPVVNYGLKKALASTGCRATLIPPISAVGLKCVYAARSKPRAHHALSPPSHAAPLPSGNDAWLATSFRGAGVAIGRQSGRPASKLYGDARCALAFLQHRKQRDSAAESAFVHPMR